MVHLISAQRLNMEETMLDVVCVRIPCPSGRFASFLSSLFTVHHRGISTCSGKGAASLEMQQRPPRHTLEH